EDQSRTSQPRVLTRPSVKSSREGSAPRGCTIGNPPPGVYPWLLLLPLLRRLLLLGSRAIPSRLLRSSVAAVGRCTIPARRLRWHLLGGSAVLGSSTVGRWPLGPVGRLLGHCPVLPGSTVASGARWLLAIGSSTIGRLPGR